MRGCRADLVSGRPAAAILGGMDSDAAELSSVNTQLDELTERIHAAARRYHADNQEDVASELYEVERHLRSAVRRLSRLRRARR